jgi:phytoene dehydrogenase-like protein
MDDQFDCIVVGAGLAGLSCAGELILEGKRPLLVCETKEVGAIFATRSLGDGNTFFAQHLTWQSGWGGGWWFQLARALNIPLPPLPRDAVGRDREGEREADRGNLRVRVRVRGHGRAHRGLPFPLDRNKLEKVLVAALAIPHNELFKMHQVRLSDWLEEQGADELISTLLLSLCGCANDLSAAQAREHLSVPGGLGVMRVLFCGDGSLPLIYPNPREGLCIPLAREIERRGGTVWRGRKVQRVLTEGTRSPVCCWRTAPR